MRLAPHKLLCLLGVFLSIGWECRPVLACPETIPAIPFEASLRRMLPNLEKEDVKRLMDLTLQGDAKAKVSLALWHLLESGPSRMTSDRAMLSGYLLVEASAAGLSEAKYVLGVLFAQGWGGPVEMPFAFRLVQAAALQGVPEAEATLGYMLEHGLGVVRQPASARIWYYRAAAHGVSWADLELGKMYANGDGGSKNVPGALMRYRRAADAAYAPAMTALGDYMAGDGRDGRSALEWYRRAAEQEEPKALRALALHAKEVEHNLPLAIDYMERAAMAKNDQAALELGKWYRFGWVDSPDLSKAYRWLRLAAEHGYGPAQLALAELLEQRGAGSADWREAYQWRVLATNNGIKAAPERATARLETGNLAQAQFELYKTFSVREYHASPWVGVAFDDTEALKWLKRAAEHGHADARLIMGYKLHPDWRHPPFPAEALYWFRQAAEVGQQGGMLRLAEHYDATGDQKEAQFWREMASMSDTNDLIQRAQRVIGLTMPGRPGPHDVGRALQLYQRAAERGSGMAAVNLGHKYRSGNGVPRDYAEARRWYLRAAMAGDRWAEDCLGEMYERGEGGPIDHEQAVQWYLRSAGHGHPWGQRRVGDLYARGHLMPKDPQMALFYYQKAAENRDDLAYDALGAMYEHGNGIPVDLPTAYMWYRMEDARRKPSPGGLARVEKAMTPQQLARGKRILEVFKHHHPQH